MIHTETPSHRVSSAGLRAEHWMSRKKVPVGFQAFCHSHVTTSLNSFPCLYSENKDSCAFTPTKEEIKMLCLKKVES